MKFILEIHLNLLAAFKLHKFLEEF